MLHFRASCDLFFIARKNTRKFIDGRFCALQAVLGRAYKFIAQRHRALVRDEKILLIFGFVVV